MRADGGHGQLVAAAPGSRVTRLELFYDLVFVLAFLNVTTLLAERLTVRVLLGGLVVLTLLWWCWVNFVALGNVVRADQGVVPLIGALTVAALLVLTLTLPEAFVDQPGAPRGPLVFAACYLLIRGLQVGVLLTHSRTPRWVLRMGLPLLASGALIVAGAAVPRPSPPQMPESWLRLGLWAAAVTVEFTALARTRSPALTVVSAGHWADRYALIVLIALGESIISLGLGSEPTPGLPLRWPVIVAAVLGVAVIAALWWMYFDTLAPALEQKLHGTRDPTERAGYARDIYTVLHLALIAGVILLALGLQRYLATIAERNDGPWTVRAAGLDHVVLFGGVIIYVATLIAIGARAFHRVRIGPTVTVVALAVGTPLAGRLPAVAGLASLAVVCVSLVLVQLRTGGARRQLVRETALEEQRAVEREQSAWRRRHL